MCGIYGELLLSGAAPPSECSDNALDRLTHRGPDERGSWRDERVFLGSRRLSIIDLAGGSQPIHTADDRFVIVYNGELYNFLDLQAELRAAGMEFRTHADTEVVLLAYVRWGPECLKKFNGMFAFAIWDRQERELFVARDRLGEKPLYYYRDAQRLVFASEIKALTANEFVERRVSHRGLANYLAVGHAVAPETIYENVLKLLPGHFLRSRGGSIQVQQYWDVGDEPVLSTATPHDEATFIENIRTLLDDSVARRMIADVPVGSFLSGGIDSAAVTALMCRHAGAVTTFSLGFGERGYNELSSAAQTARELGTKHHELLVADVDLVQTLKDLVYAYDEPFGDAAGFPVLLLSRFAREHVKVVLTGDGGDELFGGYRRYSADLLAATYHRLPEVVTDRWVPAAANALRGARRIKRAAQALKERNAGVRYAGWLEVFDKNLRAELLLPSVRESLGDYDPLWQYPQFYASSSIPQGDVANRLMYIDLKTWLVDDYLEKMDKATMAASLEARIPILDHRLVELAFQIPGHMKIRGWSRKRIFRKALRGIVPESVLSRPKRGFSVPTDPWFRGSLRDFTFQVLLDPGAHLRGILDPVVIERIWAEHGTGRHAWDTQLWTLLNLELWYRTFMESPQ